MGRDLQGAGEAITQAHDTIRKAYDYQQEGEFKLGVYEDMGALETRAQADVNNTGDRSTYDSAMNVSKANRLKGVTDPQLKSKLAMDFDLQAAQTKSSINTIFRKNMVSKGQAVTQSWSDKLVDNGSPRATEELTKLWDNAKAKGFYDADTAYRLKSVAIDKNNWNAFTQIAKTRGIDAAKTAVANKEVSLNQDQAEKSLSYLNNLKNLEDKNAVIDKIDSRYNLVDAIAQGKEDVFDLSPQAQAMVDNDEILSAAVAKARQSKSGYLTETTEAENYVKVFDEASKATDRDALSSLATSMIYRDKNINSDKLGLVLFYAGQKAKNLNLSEKILEPIGNETTPEQIKALQIDAGVNAISRWAKAGNVSTKNHSAVIFDYLEKVKTGSNPRETLNIVINEANLRLHTGMSGYPKAGQLVQDAYGRRGLAMPDGSVQPVAVSKPKNENKESKAIAFEDL
jgi:hypothetical protein